ncbi:MAG: right-handed parallel beta-helix repeat-containing protein [Actinomycetota bacterium]|nr:right-handed parallel beta-helix repeat-containing protein [Actinomycetota bacterium]
MSLRRGFSVLVVAVALPLLQLPPSAEAAATVVARMASGVQAWSDPQTWGGRVPAGGDLVRIPAGASVLLDVGTAPLGGLQIDGTLAFAEKNLSLTSEWIMVHGTLRIGKKADPYRRRALITLTGDKGDPDVMGMGTRFLGVMGGNLELHGRKTKGWTTLGSTARRGHRTITLAEAPGWRPGDRIVVASTDYWSRHYEQRTVTRVSGRSIELDEPLDYMHWGELQPYGAEVVDERAEVGLLTRNIVIRGTDASSSDGFGGHVMVMEGGRARVEGVEFENMGQANMLRRYPVHFHMEGRAPDSYLRRSSIHHSFNRCVVVHGTNELTIKGNVCFDHVGHGFFLEDGAERDNVIAGNLGLGTRGTGNGLLPSDRRPATFWITNPDNVVKDNVAGGSEGFGFWYALPEHPTGLSNRQDIWPRRTPLGEFSGNVAHSNGDTGLNVDDGPGPDGRTDSSWYKPVSDPTNPNSAPVVAHFEAFTAYMNRDRGVWLRGENHVVTGAVLADNRAGATFASDDTFLEDSLLVGESANPGTPEPWEETGHEGRALPLFWEPDAPIVGFEFYDGRVGTRRTDFFGFNSNLVRKSGALGYLAPNAFPIDPRNFSESVQVTNSNPVYLADPEPGMDGDASKVFVDKDGSLTGTPGNVVVVNNPFLLRDGCEFRAQWNAQVCPPTAFATFMAGTLTGDSQDVKPVILTRSDGITQTLMGCCDNSDEAHTTIITNRSYEVAFNGGTPSEFRFVFWRGRGRWVRVEVPLSPGFKVTRWGYPLASVSSLSALDQRIDSGYYYDPASSTLHLKLSGDDSDWEEIRVESL